MAAQSPLGIGDTLSFGYKFRGASEFLRTSVRAFLALHESTLESLGATFAQKNHRLRDPDQAEEEASLYIHLLFEK